jgi:predicted RNase H-like HicB family nuclease
LSFRDSVAFILSGATVKTLWNEVWEEVVRAARQAPRLYFAPLVGAIRHTRLVLQQIERENAQAQSAGEAGRERAAAAVVMHAIIERDLKTGILVGSVPGVPGAHTQGGSIDEVRQNLAEVLLHLQEQQLLHPDSEFVATIPIAVA